MLEKFFPEAPAGKEYLDGRITKLFDAQDQIIKSPNYYMQKLCRRTEKPPIEPKSAEIEIRLSRRKKKSTIVPLEDENVVHLFIEISMKI